MWSRHAPGATWAGITQRHHTRVDIGDTSRPRFTALVTNTTRPTGDLFLGPAPRLNLGRDGGAHAGLQHSGTTQYHLADTGNTVWRGQWRPRAASHRRQRARSKNICRPRIERSVRGSIQSCWRHSDRPAARLIGNAAPRRLNGIATLIPSFTRTFTWRRTTRHRSAGTSWSARRHRRFPHADPNPTATVVIVTSTFNSDIVGHSSGNTRAVRASTAGRESTRHRGRSARRPPPHETQPTQLAGGTRI